MDPGPVAEDRVESMSELISASCPLVTVNPKAT